MVIARILPVSRHVLVLALIGFCSHSETLAQFHVSELRALSRTGGRSGSSFDAHVVAGERLDDVNGLVFSHPDIAASQKTSDPLPFTDQPVGQSGKFMVTIGDDVPVGRYEVRTLGRHGLSNPRAFFVTHFENEVVTKVSHQMQTAT
ncbi:MAG: hypothetical protein ACR2NZ_08160, partial [Rubripirellula sp.]